MKKNQPLFVILLLYFVVAVLLTLSYVFHFSNVLLNPMALPLFPMLFLIGVISSLISVIKYGSRKAFLISFYVLTLIIIFLSMLGEGVVFALNIALIGILVIGTVIIYNVLWSRAKKIVFAVFQSIVTILALCVLIVFGWLATNNWSISS